MLKYTFLYKCNIIASKMEKFLNFNTDNTELGKTLLEQGVKFTKYQKKIIKKQNKKVSFIEGFQQNSQNPQNPQNPQNSQNSQNSQNNFNTESNQNQAIRRTDMLINITNETVINKMQELETLQNNFNTLLEQYNNSNSSFIGATQTYVNNSNVSSNPNQIKQTNVLVNTAVSNPKSTYLGCYVDNSANLAMNGAIPLSGQSVTYNQCQQNAADNGYQYFGLQNYNSGNATALCYASNDLTTSTQYGKSAYNYTTLWQSNTSGEGNYVQLLTTGSLVVMNSNGTPLFETSTLNSCITSYGETTSQDAPGNDIASYSGDNITPQYCQSLCNQDINCAGYVMNSTTNTQCWIKSEISNLTASTDRTIFKRTGNRNDLTTCQFTLSLVNGCIYINQQNNSTEVWNSGTAGQQQQPSPSWNCSNGKYGTNTLTTNQTLGPNEWICSTDNTIQLIMLSTGNLVLQTSVYTSSCIQSGGYTYGGPSVNAIYEISQVGNTSNIGKVGYLDKDSTLYEYPTSMITTNNANTYNELPNYNKPGNDIQQLYNSTVDACQTLCNSNADCGGFIFETDNNTCWIKNDSLFSATNGEYSPTNNAYLRNPAINNNNSCNKEVTAIDSIQWDNYTQSDNQMTQSTLCGLEKSVNSENAVNNNTQTQLANIANDIVNKITYLKSLNREIIEQTGIDKNILNVNLQKYKELSNKFSNYTLDNSNINGIITDSDIMLLQKNYTYMLWSIFAIIIIILTIHVF